MYQQDHPIDAKQLSNTQPVLDKLHEIPKDFVSKILSITKLSTKYSQTIANCAHQIPTRRPAPLESKVSGRDDNVQINGLFMICQFITMIHDANLLLSSSNPAAANGRPWCGLLDLALSVTAWFWTSWLPETKCWTSRLPKTEEFIWAPRSQTLPQTLSK